MEPKSQSVSSLIEVCEQELEDRGYGIYRHRKLSRYWQEFSFWMEEKELPLFTAEIGYKYCHEVIGSDLLNGVTKENRLKLRAIRMLISYHCDGRFEFRTPSVAQREFHGEIGGLIESYLERAQSNQDYRESTLNEKRIRLHEFCSYLENLSIPLNDVNTQTLADFIDAQSYSLSKTRYFSATVKQFFRYAHDVGATSGDLSFMVMPVSKGPQKLPSTYTEDEIRRMLASVERGAAIGKRDYLVLLLAAEYGWRSSDITGFQFNWVDWDRNTVSFDQHKTGAPVQYPLLSSVGNAIVDYLKNGRPATSANEIIVGHDTASRGKKLSSSTIHSIVARYIKASNIENWRQKKHGPHALRFSLATNLLKKNASLQVIATVLGHQSTESTKRYISLDIDQLRACALPIPALSTDIFEVAL